MFRIGDIALRRESHKLVVSNVPENWHQSLTYMGLALSLLELILALIGFYAALTGDTFSLPLITVILAVLIFVELGRPDIEINRGFSYTSPVMTMGPGGQSRRHHDPPIELVSWEYLDEDGDPIPHDELGLYGSEEVEIELPNGNLNLMMEEGGATFGMELPYPIQKINLCGEEESFKYDDLGKNEQEDLEGEADIEQALVRDEASISFDIPRDELLPLGRKFHATAADGSKTIELVSTEKFLEYRYSQDTYAHTVRASKEELEQDDKYRVSLRWKPGQLRMDIGPVPQS